MNQFMAKLGCDSCLAHVYKQSINFNDFKFQKQFYYKIRFKISKR